MLYIYLVFGSVRYLPIRDEINVLFIRRIWTGKSKTLKNSPKWDPRGIKNRLVSKHF